MIALLATAAAVLGLVIVATSVGANSAGFAITAILLGFGLAPFAGDSLERHVPRSLWDRLSLSHNAYRRLSLPLFNSLLSAVGWNRLIIALRDEQSGESDANRTIRNSRPVQASAAGHTWALLLHIVAAIWAGIAGGWVVSLVLLLIGVFGHLYPVLLQVRVLTRWRELGRI
ncbi:hypothetical protein [Corynebacterium appendicis]|uniref:glycosyl-4,4'-diaponeurosporenoate acyltransferase CrtO family protein n=1 Tax=Corynebacterium appendicis TaxID=163202 RepID=UPI00223C288D|nr:hypothetical protein [Corynebacterium appendicis]MCT1684166.1 hypothetical protein [Corynebacterium appendicis]MDK8626278.1 hypothetical protein [Corynebacterium appendicis]